MKILLLLTALPALASAATAGEPSRTGAVNPLRPVAETVAKACPNSGAHYAQTPLRAVPQRLIDLPPARLELTVLHTLNGCPQPIVLREGIGGSDPDGRPAR